MSLYKKIVFESSIGPCCTNISMNGNISFTVLMNAKVKIYYNDFGPRTVKIVGRI